MSDHIQRIDEVIATLRKGSTQQSYFFTRVRDPRWLEPLREAGLFAKPYQSIRSGEGVRYPSWPQAEYLERVAESESDCVFAVLMEMSSTDNERVWGQLAGVAMNLSPDKAAAWSERLSVWVSDQTALWGMLAESAAGLCGYLARNGETEAALGIVDAMLALRDEPDPVMSSLTKSTRRRARMKLGPYEMREFISAVRDPLVAADGTGYCRLLLDRLTTSVYLSVGEDVTQGTDYSDIWRPLVSEDERYGHDDVRDELIDALRDSLIQLSDVSPGDARQVLADMQGEQALVIARRIALHVISARPRVFADQLDAIAINPEYWADTRVWPEMAEVLRVYCSGAGPESVLEVIALAEAGHEAAALRDVRDADGEPLPEEQIQRYAEGWLHRRLAVLEQWLPEQSKKRLAELDASRGEISDPRLRNDRGESWVGPTSPLDVARLKSMTIDEIVEYLEHWRPTGEWMSPTYEGLARTLQADAKDRPLEYFHRAEAIAEAHPSYVGALLQSIREVADVGPELWERVIATCEYVLGRDDSAPVHDDGDGWDYSWHSVQRTVASLLNHSLERRPVSISVMLAGRIWALVDVLAQDSDPTPEQEAQYGGSNMDPLTLAINSTRGTAIEAACAYMVWRRLRADDDGVQLNMAQLPEVADLMLLHTERAEDPSVAVRAAMGVSLGRFAWFDEEWLSSHIESFLPMEHASRDLWEGAWGAFLNYARPFGAAVQLFRSSYELSVDLLSDESAIWVNHDWRSKIGQHLVSFVIWGTLIPDDALFEGFLENAPADMSGAAVGFLGEIVRDARGLEPEVLQRAMQVWDASMRKGETYFEEVHRPPEGASNFAPWFAAESLDRGWRIQQLLRSLELYHAVENGYQVMRSLPDFAIDYPVESLRALRRLLRADSDRFITSSSFDAIGQTVQGAVGSGDASAREEAKAVVDLLTSMGNYEARGLLPS
ncbi:MAG TPA: hypothetical protein DCP20_01545 [Coriobacteriia bacterium]|nr:MAG: Uncharacterized protein XD74_0845 [Actinobacteria bacterium 66_15]HAL29389.1 hypothetical protein [Coriobacteriia bacterium]